MALYLRERPGVDCDDGDEPMTKRWRRGPSAAHGCGQGYYAMPPPVVPPTPPRMPLDGMEQQEDASVVSAFPSAAESPEMNVDYARVNSTLKQLHLERLDRRIRSVTATHEQRRQQHQQHAFTAAGTGLAEL